MSGQNLANINIGGFKRVGVKNFFMGKNLSNRTKNAL